MHGTCCFMMRNGTYDKTEKTLWEYCTCHLGIWYNSRESVVIKKQGIGRANNPM